MSIQAETVQLTHRRLGRSVSSPVRSGIYKKEIVSAFIVNQGHAVLKKLSSQLIPTQHVPWQKVLPAIQVRQ